MASSVLAKSLERRRLDKRRVPLSKRKSPVATGLFLGETSYPKVMTIISQNPQKVNTQKKEISIDFTEKTIEQIDGLIRIYSDGNRPEYKATLAACIAEKERRQIQTNVHQLSEQVDEPRFKPFTLTELFNQPKKEWLIDRVIGKGDIGMIFGDPGSGKSFIAIDMIFSGCTATAFAGEFEVTRPLRIAYAASEGKGGLPQRFCAAMNARSLSPDSLPGLTVFFDVPQLFNLESPESVYKFVSDWKTNCLGELDIVVIDTLHGSIAGGDENSSKDAAIIIQSMQYIRNELGCAVIVVHHANRQGNYRGSSAFHGSVDTMLQTKKNGHYTLECSKLKDDEAWLPKTFILKKDITSDSASVAWMEYSEVNTPAIGGKINAVKEKCMSIILDNPGIWQGAIEARFTKGEASHPTILKALEQLTNDGKIVATVDNLDNNRKSFSTNGICRL